ncbi:TldE/PmbA family protein, Beta/Gamma-proteobacterial subgroup [hydrothermal vent metagenome]|uniref:TldE/PmbA family protein, Beta/Gamma-proteobacterial subgroup n=1 Tax=hydrothermal vent metagenome TaxID=652676 RepID=A0A3B1A4M8_9ZZZZ
MQNYFNELIDKIVASLESDEILLANLIGEKSAFVRLNHNRIRQAGNVLQTDISLDLIIGSHHASASCNLVGDSNTDLYQLSTMVNNLREQCKILAEDPYLYYATEIKNTELLEKNQLPNVNTALDYIMEQAQDLDLVGIWASGEQYHGFANSMGQRNWHSKPNFNFDWSVYFNKDKAVKNDYAGFDWQEQSLKSKMQETRLAVDIISRPAKQLKPDNYRVYLSPVALNEIIGTAAWGGFGLKSHRTSQTPLIQMITADKKLHETVTLKENHQSGLTPSFTRDGFIKPPYVNLIENGRYKDCLVNSRSAQEFQQAVNASGEFPDSFDLKAGSLAQNEILKALDTGIYINNLWYCNFSDRESCRITGMTRYACFWVENAEIVAPINVMRFDETIYKILGSELVALTSEREFIFDSSSYFFRSNSSANMPGALVDNFCLTL